MLGTEIARLSILRRLETPVWIFDIDNLCIVFANDAACRIWGSECEAELRMRDMSSGMSSTVSNRLKQYQHDFKERDATFTEQWTLYPKDEPKSVMVVFRGFDLPDGRKAMQCEAISEAENTPQNLRSAEALLHTDVMIALYTQNGPPLYLNPAARNSSLLVDAPFADIFAAPQDYYAFMTELDRTGEYRLVAKVNTCKGDRWLDLSAKNCLDAATGKPAILLTAIDVSELKEARDTARHLADRDQLTNLYNRAFLQSHFLELSTRADDLRSALIFFDVDRFKTINDRYGHDAGDTVLKEIAKRTTLTLRCHDIATRLGGDEFVIVLEGIDDRVDFSHRVEELRTAISQPIQHNNTSIETTVSIGLVVFSPSQTEFEEALGKADLALYKSKEAGRNRVTYYTDAMGDAARYRDQMEVDLKHALEMNQFELYYQPRLDIRTGRIVSVEGLVRWVHPEKGVIMPGSFIPICEETGMIEELGRKVLELGCKQAISWQRNGLEIGLSLNVSPRQFSDERFMPILSALADDPEFPVGKIELEITESVLIGDHEWIAEKLRTITTMGYRIAIDDFGTGYSNLSYISRFPLTCLKIDRSFIKQLPASGPIIRLILTLGQQIGATVVSEGIETEDQLNWLAEWDCDQAQGYLISHPLPVKDLVTYLRHPIGTLDRV